MSISSIDSTKENKLKQKSAFIKNSSAIFYIIKNDYNELNTSISFLNHFLLKRKIDEVECEISIRNMDGSIQFEEQFIIKDPRTYILECVSKLPPVFEGAAYLRFRSNDNLAVPFCAVCEVIESKNGISGVHTYGRILEDFEYGSFLDFDETIETGWTLRDDKRCWSFGMFHNGKTKTNLDIEIAVLNCNGISVSKSYTMSCNAYQTIKIVPQQHFPGLIDHLNGSIGHATITISGLKQVFPRMLVGNALGMNVGEMENVNDIQITHSNFDFSNIHQPNSNYNFAYFNQPQAPASMEGLVYPTFVSKAPIEVGDLKIVPNKINLFPTENLSQTSVSSSSELPTRLVSASIIKWDQGDKIGGLDSECSTGIFVREYTEVETHWHWGMLTPDLNTYNAILTIIPNNFQGHESPKNSLEVEIYSSSGLETNTVIPMPKSEMAYEIGDFFDESSGQMNMGKQLWYVVKGEHVEHLNIFATTFKYDLSSGFVEHAF